MALSTPSLPLNSDLHSSLQSIPGTTDVQIVTESKRQSSQKRWVDQILTGDAAHWLPRIPDQFVDVVISSPPYYRQRDYGVDCQIGSERTLEEYVLRLVDVFAKVRPKLKDSGTLWLVLGDKYQNQQLLGLPWRVALALQADGWLLRSDVIWHKPNAMPSSVKNRPTTDHEYIFLFAKTAEYYYDADAIREPHVTFSSQSQMKGGRRHFGIRGGTPEQGKNQGRQNLHDGRWDQAFHPQGRNKRTVWNIPLSKSRDAHFAVFPEALVKTCLAATCPAGGLALDPFCGSGTVAVVAAKMGYHYLGIDCVPEYCQLARRRLESLKIATGKKSQRRPIKETSA